MSAQNNIDNIILKIFEPNKVFCDAGGTHPEIHWFGGYDYLKSFGFERFFILGFRF